MKLGRLGIRKQVLYLVLACSLITLVIAGTISVYGIYKIKSDALSMGREIGEAAAETGSNALKEVTVASLQGLANERATQVNSVFGDFIWDVSTVSDEMTTILQNSQNYSPRQVYAPDRRNAGKHTAQLFFADDSLKYNSDLRKEILLTANVQDFLVRISASDKSVASTYVVSKNGFQIVSDTISDKRVNEHNEPLNSDFRTRVWYKKALEKKEAVFSDIFLDLYGRGLAISCAKPYYDAEGNIAGVAGEGRLLTAVSQIVNKTKIGNTGFGFIMNETGHVLFSPKPGGVFAVDYDKDLKYEPSLFEEKNETLANTAKLMAGGASGVALIDYDGQQFYLAYTPLDIQGWSFGVVMDVSEIVNPAKISQEAIEKITENLVGVLNSSIRFMLLAIILAFIAIIALIPFAGRAIADKFTEPLKVLTDGVREIASGNLDKKLDIKTGNEFEHLAVCFNAMTTELQTYMKNLETVAAEKERIATELNVATEIQTSMLPHDFDFDRNDIELFATMNAAKKVGGDFYDFYFLDENHLVVTMADVSGKGIPAALFMVVAKTILKNFALTMSNPDDFAALMTCANNQLCENNDAMMFVTVFMGMLDTKTGEFVFVNGGHNPPLVYRKSEDKFDYLKVEKNFVLGGMENIDFVQQSVKLERGDMIYFYTDGVTEALNKKEELFGEERLKESLNKIDKSLSVNEILAAVRKDVNSHVNGAEQSDDITMLGLKFK